VRAFTALRVVAGVGGARRRLGLEPPCVGRDRELGWLSSPPRTAPSAAWGGSSRDGRGRHREIAAAVGVLQVHGRHRAEPVVARGALLEPMARESRTERSEMIRARAGIAEEEDPAAAREKLRATVERCVGGERKRRLVEPRLARTSSGWSSGR
jgi:hypothetical protein